METSLQDIPLERRPKHIAVIMDGNGRWAQRQGKPRIDGHIRGVESVRNVMDGCREFGVEVLTLYCLSSENWKRPPQELEFLMMLLKQYLIGERETLVKHNLRLRIIGQRERLPAEVQQEMDQTLLACSQNDGMTLCLAINYGSRAEIVDAIQAIAERVRAGEVSVADIDESLVSNHLYTAGLPDPDLLIRTSGEMRISNYLLWQISYSELWVTDTLWPDFGKEQLGEAIIDYARRKRRFGGLDRGAPQDGSPNEGSGVALTSKKEGGVLDPDSPLGDRAPRDGSIGGASSDNIKSGNISDDDVTAGGSTSDGQLSSPHSEPPVSQKTSSDCSARSGGRR